METVTIDIGGPADVDITNARRGSAWVLPCGLAFTEDDGVDATTITRAVLALKPRSGDSEAAALELTGEIGDGATPLAVAFTFRAGKDDTLEVSPGLYRWDFEFEADGEDNPLDGWAPAGGTWRVVDRVVERDEVS